MRNLKVALGVEGAEEAAERSARGLDRVKPDWFREITPKQIRDLDQVSPFRCVLHLAFGSYTDGLNALRREPEFRTATSRWTFHPGREDRRLAALNEAWRWEIETRQALAGERNCGVGVARPLRNGQWRLRRLVGRR